MSDAVIKVVAPGITGEYPDDATIIEMMKGLHIELGLLDALELAYPLSAEVKREKARCLAAVRKLEVGPPAS